MARLREMVRGPGPKASLQVTSAGSPGQPDFQAALAVAVAACPEELALGPAACREARSDFVFRSQADAWRPVVVGLAWRPVVARKLTRWHQQ